MQHFFQNTARVVKLVRMFSSFAFVLSNSMCFLSCSFQGHCSFQWKSSNKPFKKWPAPNSRQTKLQWKITKYIYSSTVLKYNFELLVLYLSISVWCYFILPLHYISEGNIVLSTPLHLFDSFSYFSDEDLTQWII